jgi:hypothetical protein
MTTLAASGMTFLLELTTSESMEMRSEDEVDRRLAEAVLFRPRFLFLPCARPVCKQCIGLRLSHLT